MQRGAVAVAVEEIVRVRVDGIEEAIRRLSALDRNARRRVVSFAVRAGLRVALQRAKEEVPVRTGGLRASLRIASLRLDRASGTVTGHVQAGKKSKRMEKKGLTAYYAHMVTGGTRPHQIQPHKTKALLIGGKYAASAQHPGTSANPFMERALSRSFNLGVDAFRRAFGIKMDEEVAKL
jgi:HK97 gp10 family phage protein